MKRGINDALRADTPGNLGGALEVPDEPI